MDDLTKHVFEREIAALRERLHIAEAVRDDARSGSQLNLEEARALRAEVELLRERAENAEAALKTPELHWECQQRIDALEAARDEACEIASHFVDAWGATRPSEIAAAERIAELRRVGSS